MAVAAVMTSSAGGALFFLFKPTTAKPYDRVTVRLGGTPATFTPARRVKPHGRSIRVYLVQDEVAEQVRGRFDSRLHFVGDLVPDGNGHGILGFRVPPLDSGLYVAAAWCPGCAGNSFGRTFFVLPVTEDIVPRYRPLMGLRVEMPSASESCPVTIPRGGKPPLAPQPRPYWYGNGYLWTQLTLDGVYREPESWPVDPAGRIGAKFYWFARGGASLTVEGERLDGDAPRIVVNHTNRGQSSGWSGPTWAAAFWFPSEGCWRLTARVDDVALTYVLKVERR